MTPNNAINEDRLQRCALPAAGYGERSADRRRLECAARIDGPPTHYSAADLVGRFRNGGAAKRSSRNSALKSTMRHMDAVRIETTVDERGEIHFTTLPFPAGEPVEVIVVPQPARQQGKGFPLRGVPIKYDRPTDPVAEEDWDALR